jgi:putative membrane protein
MTNLLIGWVASAVALYVVTLVVPGVSVAGVTAALVAALVIGLVNTTIGTLLKLLTLPIGCLTLGLSSLLINGLMFMLAANLVPGFRVDGYLAALLGSIVMSVVNWALFAVLKQDGAKKEK